MDAVEIMDAYKIKRKGCWRNREAVQHHDIAH
jgi:hypothetical protein